MEKMYDHDQKSILQDMYRKVQILQNLRILQEVLIHVESTFLKSVPCALGINRMTTRIEGSVHLTGSVFFGTRQKVPILQNVLIQHVDGMGHFARSVWYLSDKNITTESST